MTAPPVFPLRPTPAAGPFRRTPPMIFLAIVGLQALGIAWRHGAYLFGVPPGLVETFLGAVTLLWVFASLAYLGKIARRPGVLREELTTMPGRVGVSSAILSVYFIAIVLAPYLRPLAWTVLVSGFVLHVLFAGLLIAVMRAGPPEARVVTPVWQVSFTGFIVGGLGAAALGLHGLSVVLVCGAIPLAAVIWVSSLVQLIGRVPPAPLRPLLAFHLAPASLLTTVSAMQGHPLLATGFALLGAAMLAAMIVSARWILVSGFSAFWGALAFPIAAYANALLAMGGGWPMAGAVVLIAATLAVPPIAVKVLQAWIKGDLAARTNAATA